MRYHEAMSAGPDARAPDPSLRSIKQALRGRILAVRDDFPAEARREASLALVARIAALPSFDAAGAVLLTLPYRSEWDTKPLAATALAQGKLLAMPRVDRVARMLVLHRVIDLDRDIVPGVLGIPEPRPFDARSRLDQMRGVDLGRRRREARWHAARERKRCLGRAIPRGRAREIPSR